MKIPKTVTYVCRHCQQPVDESDRFCRNCGAPWGRDGVPYDELYRMVKSDEPDREGA